MRGGKYSSTSSSSYSNQTSKKIDMKQATEDFKKYEDNAKNKRRY